VTRELGSPEEEGVDPFGLSHRGMTNGPWRRIERAREGRWWQHRNVADSQEETTTVLVVDDHRAFAEAVAMAVEVKPGFHALGIATTVKEALCSFEAGPPDVALVDIALPDGNGLDLTAQIKERYPSIRVVVITGHESTTSLALVAEAGADDLRPKSVSLNDLLTTLKGPAWQPLASQRDPSANELETGASRAQAPDLTPREREVLDLLGQGRPPKLIAGDLGISLHTCRAHIRAIYDKLDVHSQLAAVAQAARLGLFTKGRE
jgi:DNA-binding NarL/FixJ family response regulator